MVQFFGTRCEPRINHLATVVSATANPGTRHDMASAGITQRSTLLGLPRREPCQKSWMLNRVTFTLDADRPTIAPTLCLIMRWACVGLSACSEFTVH